MNADIPFWLSIFFIVGGLALLAYSSNAFIDASASIARRFGISPFIVGMVIIGFGTSAPELCVSAMSGAAGHSNLSLGNAYGSCVFNIAAILGIAALIRPISISRSTVLFGAPMLIGIALLQYLFLRNGGYSRVDGIVAFLCFCVILPVYCWYEKRETAPVAEEEKQDAADRSAIVKSFVALVAGLVLLVSSSHILVWGCVDIARALNVSELLIGLTVVAIGTSLPELASAIAAARKNEHELVVGNIVGSNLFNTLAVVGIAGTIQPFEKLSKFAVSRDVPVTVIVSAILILVGVNWKNFKKPGIINRFEGFCFVVFFAVYLAVMAYHELYFAK